MRERSHTILFGPAQTHSGSQQHQRIASTLPALAQLSHDLYLGDAPRIALPRAECQLIIRRGPMSPRGLDASVMGPRDRVRRKQIRDGQQTLIARLRLGASEAVLGVAAEELAGQIVRLEELWGANATRRLLERLSSAHDPNQAAAILEAAIAERLARVAPRRARFSLALAAAEKLREAKVGAVARELGVSERHLRRQFREAIGMSPKSFSQLARFRRALSAARKHERVDWAQLASAHGYFDQAHLIAEFRAIAGVTPRALLGELRGHAMR